MTTPREKLIENIIDIVHATQSKRNDEKLAHLVKLLLATLKTHYAIGRWVRVDERLPEFKHGKWKGIFKRESVQYAGVFNFNEFVSGDEWLELDMPEVGL